MQNSPQLSNQPTPHLTQASPMINPNNAVRPLMYNTQRPPGMLPNTMLPNNRSLQDQQYLFLQQQQQLQRNLASGSPNINVRPVQNIPPQRYQANGLPDKGAPSFAQAPQQSTRCFFTQPLHGLLDQSTVFNAGYSTQSSQQIDPKQMYSRDFQQELQPMQSSGLKRKLQDLVNQISPTEKLSPESEKVLLGFADYFIEQVTHRACKLSKHTKSNTLTIKDVQLELGIRFLIEQNWNIRIPGYAVDNAQTKSVITTAHSNRVSIVNKHKKSVKANILEKYELNEQKAQELKASIELEEDKNLDVEEEIVDNRLEKEEDKENDVEDESDIMVSKSSLESGDKSDEVGDDEEDEVI
jgi:transcription initiation factor TFIID subunit 12